MTDRDPIAKAARLDAIKTVCKLEGHRWIEVGSYSDLPWRRAVCGRGCGSYRYELWRGSSVTTDMVAELLASNGGTITSIEIVSEARTMTERATGGPIEPGRAYWIGEDGPEPLIVPEATHAFDWTKAKLTVNIVRTWTPMAVEYIEDFAPEFAAQFTDHRGPEHRLALLHAGIITAATAWRCTSCNVGGDLP